jgi:hypothetical protein
MSDTDHNLPAFPTDLEYIKEFDSVAHVRVEGEITFASIQDGGKSQHTWSWSKQCIVPTGHQETATFWQVLRFWIEDREFTKREMLDWLETTATRLRGEIEEDTSS